MPAHYLICFIIIVQCFTFFSYGNIVTLIRSEYRDHIYFSCINICCGSRKFFEPEAARPRVQTASERHG